MENEQLNEDAILGGDDFEATTYSNEDAILGEVQTAEPKQTQQVEEVAQPQAAQQPEPPQVDDRQAYAWGEMNRKLQERERELEALRAQQEAAQQQVDAGLLGDEELGYINSQLEQRDRFYQQQIAQMQAGQSLQQAAFHAEMNKETLGFGWQDALNLAREEALRQAPIYGVSPEQLFAAIDASPDAGQRILALAQMAKERQAAQQPVDWDKKLADAKAKARAEALKEFQSRSAASPHNLAPPGVGSIPAVTVTPTRAMTEDEILSQ